ncbi:hypothetical protein GCM10010300_10350 [Streptomyces olivaceoviridis]|nr:hypothetical protein GCM10010300_10350 [Streptomyces olivaceoviridis]
MPVGVPARRLVADVTARVPRGRPGRLQGPRHVLDLDGEGRGADDRVRGELRRPARDPGAGRLAAVGRAPEAPAASASLPEAALLSEVALEEPPMSSAPPHPASARRAASRTPAEARRRRAVRGVRMGGPPEGCAL